MKYDSFLKLPKQEEQEVPDTTIGTTTASNDEQKVGDNVMEELEGIFGVEEDVYNLPEQDNISGSVYGNVDSWDFIDWVERPSGEDMDYNNDMNDRSNFFEENSIHNYEEYFDGCRVIKSESVGVLDDGNDEKIVPLNLNLNHQKVLDAWSDRRTPWAQHSSLPISAANAYYMGEVPVMEEERRRREASVLRYKEKRQSRLFCKKIRYQVRKLNADKRPRLKGRFVRRI